MLKYLAIAASLAVASCGAAPAFAVDCPKGSVSIEGAIENLLSYPGKYEIVGVFPVPLTKDSATMLAHDGKFAYSALAIGGCVAPEHVRVEGVYKEEKDT